MTSIFVSYRRSDAPGHAGRLSDRLVDRFGEANVFKDLDTMEPGADFVDVIEETVARCDALVAVIGPNWFGGEHGGVHRLDDPRDWVRLEIAKALQRRIRVVPVLVLGASMPRASDLPEDLQGLARRHAIELSETVWTVQVNQLIEAIQKGLSTVTPVAAASSPEPAPLTDRPQRRDSSFLETPGDRSGPAAGLPTVAKKSDVASPPAAPAARFGSMREVARLKHGRRVFGVAFSPDGARIATASDDKTVRVWDSPSGHELARLLGHDHVVWSVAFSGDATQIATASADNTARVWDSASGREFFPSCAR